MEPSQHSPSIYLPGSVLPIPLLVSIPYILFRLCKTFLIFMVQFPTFLQDGLCPDTV